MCQTLKRDPARLHIPVVLLTGTFEPFDRDRAMAAGCDAIVTKPFEARELIDTVEQLIARAKAVSLDMGDEELQGLGVPEGVPALDFTTTGLDQMVPPPPAPLAPPEEGIELTGSLASPAAPATPPSPDGPGAAQPAMEQTVPPFALEPEPPQTGEAGPWAMATPAAAPPPAPAATVPPQEELVAPGAATTSAAEPAVPAPVAEAGELGLSEEHIERIARRVMELASEQIEKIAWEVIPDMAEMIVRQRIRELEEAAEKEN
ncbi:MAG: hypothetical protein HXY19_02890 [Thermoanaerobaculaceae bacterium]|nr:hypothetical protein [Thermoanaerobaculaceae bacterium]